MCIRDRENSISFNQRRRSLNKLYNQNGAIIADYILDTTLVLNNIRNEIDAYEQKIPIMPLFDRGGKVPDFNEIIPTKKLLLPVNKLNIPTRASRLPNAPRDYRSGIHRGIDFFSNWGTEVKSVAEGIVIRSDLNYKEIPADFRVNMLERASIMDRTPSDIFNELLLGQAVTVSYTHLTLPTICSV